MLARIRGTVIEKSETKAVIDVGGLGLEVQLSRKGGSLCSVDQQVILSSHLLFSDSGPSLFGFADELEKAVFLRLTSVKGIGGKLALQILQSMSAETVVQAISLGDPASLTKIPGIGKKTAERICFELQEKMTKNLPDSVQHGYTSQEIPDMPTVIEALESLGFGRNEASEALRSVSKDRGAVDDIGIEDLIMLVLRRLNGRS